MPNILMVTWPTTRHFKEKFYRVYSAFQKRSYVENLKSLAQAVLKICSTVCQKW